MADVVQNLLDRMLGELHDLERRGLFSGAEVDMIVRWRTIFELRLKLPSPLKEDYLAYVDYERQLDALRSLRKRAILGELARKGEKGKKWRKSISDGAGIRRILRIYKMAVIRFKGDLDLWFRHLEFCRERRHGRMKEMELSLLKPIGEKQSDLPSLLLPSLDFAEDYEILLLPLPKAIEEKQSDLQPLLCGVLQVSTVHEEAMLAIGALAYTTGVEFAKYMLEFYNYLEMGLHEKG